MHKGILTLREEPHLQDLVDLVQLCHCENRTVVMQVSLSRLCAKWMEALRVGCRVFRRLADGESGIRSKDTLVYY